MRPITLTKTLATASTNDIFTNQTLLGAGEFTLNGSGVTSGEWFSSDSVGHIVSFTSTANHSALTFTVTGFEDSNRNIAVTETISGPNNNTVSGSSYFSIITSISSDGAVGTNTSGGFAASSSTQRVPLNVYAAPFTTGIGVTITGTINFTVQHSFDDPQDVTITPVWFDTLDMDNKTTNSNGNYLAGARITRVKINSYNAGATLKAVWVQGANDN